MEKQNYVEFEIQGFSPPYDKLRLRTDNGAGVRCGTAIFGMCVDVFSHGSGNGGVIDHKELRRIRNAIDKHLQVIDALSAVEREKILRDD